MTRSIGYSRCSTTHQDTDAQVTELGSAGCQEVFAEKVSSRAPLEKRPQLRRCLESRQEGDELVVSKLDRLGRSQGGGDQPSLRSPDQGDLCRAS
ncbi:recombinase family protein [Synechococcus sp. CCY9201]|uniref:recombinase family protein n=1 Tax=Synechococcus sp. CCY9201 TaxID=174697 RepID=UPI003A4C8275